jgi:hypothetical protein
VGDVVMPAKLTQESLIRDISTKHKTIEFGFATDKVRTRNQIYGKAEHLYDFIDIEVQVANNEKKPYTSTELKFATKPMETKKVNGERQTADYVAYWKFKTDETEEFRKLGIIFERKEVSDFHQTIIHNYKRFNNEINRFIDDPSTKYMFVLVEGNRPEALAYLPPMRYSQKQVRNLIAAKIGAVASIETRGVHVCWQGSRQSSANSISGYVKHFFCKNIAEVLDI